MYLEHAMAGTASTASEDAKFAEQMQSVREEFAKYQKKDALVETLQGYVTGEAFDEKLKAYVPIAMIQAQIDTAATTAVNEVLRGTAANEMVGKIAESKVTELVKVLEARIEQLRTQVNNLEPTKDDAKDKEKRQIKQKKKVMIKAMRIKAMMTKAMIKK